MKKSKRDGKEKKVKAKEFAHESYPSAAEREHIIDRRNNLMDDYIIKCSTASGEWKT